MAKKPVTEVLAENLAYFMKERGVKQTALGVRSGIAQTTVSLYLRPDARKQGAKGSPSSGKIAHVEQLADALGVQAWELLRPMSPQARAAYEKIEKAFRDLHPEAQQDESGEIVRPAPNGTNG